MSLTRAACPSRCSCWTWTVYQGQSYVLVCYVIQRLCHFVALHSRFLTSTFTSNTIKDWENIMNSWVAWFRAPPGAYSWWNRWYAQNGWWHRNNHVHNCYCGVPNWKLKSFSTVGLC